MALGNRIWGQNPVLDWMGDCDVALVLGSNLPYRSTSGVGVKLPEKIVHVLLDEDYIGKNYDTEVGIAANSGAVVRQFLSAAGDDLGTSDDYRREIADLKASIYSGLQDQWGPELRAWEAIRSVIPDDTIFSLDATVPGQPRRALPPDGPAPQLHVPPRLGRTGLRLPRLHGGQGRPAR